MRLTKQVAQIVQEMVSVYRLTRVYI